MDVRVGLWRKLSTTFELWCWRRLLRVPWTARRSSQSILKEISPGCSLEGMVLKLNLQYFGHLCEEFTHWKRLWCWERLGAGGEGDDRGWDGWKASLTWWMWVWVNSGSWWWTGRPGLLRFMGSQRVGHNWATELNAIEMIYILVSCKGMVEIQLTQHGFELSSFTFMWIFLNKYILLCDSLQLSEFLDSEPRVQRADYKVLYEFSTVHH